MKKKIIINDEIEDIILDNIQYIERCIDIIYYNFNSFGWRHFGKDEISREDIREMIEYLLKDSVEQETECGSGRIAVDWSEEDKILTISLTL